MLEMGMEKDHLSLCSGECCMIVSCMFLRLEISLLPFSKLLQFFDAVALKILKSPSVQH